MWKKTIYLRARKNMKEISSALTMNARIDRWDFVSYLYGARFPQIGRKANFGPPLSSTSQDFWPPKKLANAPFKFGLQNLE